MIKRLAILAWICGILGLAGTIYILILIYRSGTKPEDSNAKIVEIVYVDSTRSRTPTPKPSVNRDTVVPAAQLNIEGKTADTATAPAAIVSTGKRVDSLATTTPAKPATKPVMDSVAKPKVAIEKHFKKDELKWILNKIRLEKVKHKKVVGCVQILRTAKGKTRNSAAQIESYLKENHYSIGGRETINEEIKGIKIGYNGSCIRLIVGIFYK